MIIVNNNNNQENTTMDTIIKKAGEEEIEVVIDERITGKKIIKVLKENNEYYLNSIYGEELAECWCNQCDIKGYGTVVILFGIANGEYIEKIKERNKDVTIVLYEPMYSILYAAIECIGVEDFDKKTENIILCLGKDGLMDLHNTMNTVIGYENIKNVKMMISPNYELIMREECEDFKELYNQRLMNIDVARNTIKRFNRSITKNAANNLIDCVKQYSVYNLKKEFDGLKKDKIPAIVVAAGPSLDKNISELKEAKGRAFIIAVDTALKPLANAGILPDISVTVDPNKTLSLFDNEIMRNVPIIFGLSSNEKIKDIHTGMRIYHNTDGTLVSKYMSMFKKDNFYLETGGSVANNAFSLAQKLGFKTVIFVGQDLAYPDDKGHAAAAFGEGKENDVKNQNKELFEVEDIYGGKVKTEYNMNMYRIWFENAVIKYPDIKFIDATEGGAKKKGMEIMTLKDAIERECALEKYIDFHDIISCTEHTFSHEEQSFILKDIAEFSENLKQIRKRLTEGQKTYERLDVLNRKLKYTGKEFASLIQSITELNKWVTEDKDIQYLNVYTAESNYQVGDIIYDQRDNVYEDMKLIIDNGIKMMEALINATKQVEEDLQDVIEQARLEAALY